MQPKPVINTKPGMNVVTGIKAGFQNFYNFENDRSSYRKQIQERENKPHLFEDYDYPQIIIQDLDNNPKRFLSPEHEF